MTKQRKKYNPLKSTQSCARAGLKGLIITFNAEDKACKVRSIKSGKELTVSRNMFDAVWRFRYKWGLWLAALIKEKNGKEAYTWMEVESPFPVYHEEINDSLSDQHAAFITEEKAKGNQIVNLGWLASHEGLSLNKDQVELLLHEAGI
jgi:hypothetical protein